MNPSSDGAGKYEKRMIVTCDVTNRYTGKHGRSGLSNSITIHVPVLFTFRVGFMHDEEPLAIIDSDDSRR